MSAKPVQIEETHYYVIQRLWNGDWVDSSSSYHREEGLPAAVQCETQMAAIHGVDQVKMVRRDTVVTQTEVTTDVHTEHCCARHGCKYDRDKECTVATGLRPQSHMCEDCTWELYEGDGWELAELMNEMYNKGLAKSGTCESCKAPIGAVCSFCA